MLPPDSKPPIRHATNGSRKPAWLKIRPPGGEEYLRIKGLRKGLALSTVCEEARCPNLSECWGTGTATFMLLGDTCTRHCRFCNVLTGNPRSVLDEDEPVKLLEAISTMELTYVVLTMVDRDDLDDGGASHIARCVRTLKKGLPDLKIEMLTGDFGGDRSSIGQVLESGVDVFAHNIETTRALTPSVRDRKCSYDLTLDVLRGAHDLAPATITKSSIMLGLGETEDDVDATLGDLRRAGVSVVTLGQYLRPSMKYLPVQEYVTPERFEHWKQRASDHGFLFAASGPLVRSSYKAGELFLENHLRTTGTEKTAP